MDASSARPSVTRGIAERAMISMTPRRSALPRALRTTGALRVPRLHVDEMNAEPVYRVRYCGKESHELEPTQSYLAPIGDQRLASEGRPATRRRRLPLRRVMLSLRFKCGMHPGNTVGMASPLRSRRQYEAGGAARPRVGRSGSRRPSAPRPAAAFSTVRPSDGVGIMLLRHRSRKHRARRSSHRGR